MSDLEELLVQTISLAAASEGVQDPGPFEFSDDPHVLLDQLSALSPLTAFDRQQVLEATTTSEQIQRLHDALSDKCLLLRAQLGET